MLASIEDNIEKHLDRALVKSQTISHHKCEKNNTNAPSGPCSKKQKQKKKRIK